MIYFSLFRSGFRKILHSRMQNYIGKIKILSGRDLRQTAKMNELFSPAAFASQVLFLMVMDDSR